MKLQDTETRDRLLAAAARLFASRGFKRVTVREICRSARANVAAVNYHFGDKLGLYREVLQTAVDAMRSTLEVAQIAGEDGDAEARLRAYIFVFLERIVASRDVWIHRLMTREIADPTLALDLIVEQAMKPRLQYLCAIVGELLDRPADDRRVIQCAHSIHALCVSLIPNPVASRLYPTFALTPDTVAAFSEHVAAFSIAGLRAVPPRVARSRGRRMSGRRTKPSAAASPSA